MSLLSTSSSRFPSAADEKKEDNDPLVLLDQVSPPRKNLHSARNNRTYNRLSSSASFTPLPPPGFHPDFLFCGECTECQPSPPKKLNAYPRKNHQSDDNNNNDDDYDYDDDDVLSGRVTNAATTSHAALNTKIRLTQPLSATFPTAATGAGSSAMFSPLVLQSLLMPLPGVSHVHVVQEQLNNDTSTGNDELEPATSIVVRLLLSIDHDAQCHPDQLLLVLRQAGYLVEVVYGQDEGSCHKDDDDEKGDIPHDEVDENAVPASKYDHKSTLSSWPSSPRQSIVRSTFAVQGICCASEIPSVRRIVKSLPGVTKLQINLTTKRVYVQHQNETTTASDIAAHLTQQGFPAKVLDNGASHEPGASSVTDGDNKRSNNSSIGRSTFHTQAVIHPQDIPKIQLQLAPLSGIQRIGVNVSECVLYIDHDANLVSANELQSQLQPKYAVTLIQDAATILQQRTVAVLDDQLRSKYVESTLMIVNLTRAHIPVLLKAAKQNFIRTHVRAVYPHPLSHTVKIEHNPDYCSAQLFCDTIAPYGLEAHVVTNGAIDKLYLPLIESEEPDKDDGVRDSGGEQESNNLLTAAHYNADEQSLQLPVILSGIFWVVSMCSSIGGVFSYLKYAGLLSVLFGLPPVAKKAWRTLRRREFDANCMMVTAALGAVLLQEFDEAASVSFLFAISEFLEARATDRARKALAEIVDLRPDHANVIHPVTKELVVVPATKVPVGSLISVRMGDKIAADGVVVEGTSVVDESSLTGESTPVRKTVNSIVSGGTMNIGATQLVIRTTCTVDESAVSRLIRLVEEAQANRSPTEKMIDGFARAYTPIVISCAAVMATIPWLFGYEVGRYWTLNALIIVVIACPCALTISTPVTYAAGLAAMAQRGIVVKGGASLEALGAVDKVLFDKTGTLTEGNFTVTNLEEVGDTRTRQEMLSLLALMESPSSHPLSATLVKAASREGVSIPKDVEMKDHSILKGEGVEATVNGKHVYVGNRRLFDRLGMYNDLPQAYQGLSEEWMEKGGTVGYIGVEGEGIIGVFCMIDIIRPEAKDVISSLHFGGFEVMLLTGDGIGAARTVARQVGIPESAIHSQLMPEDKLHLVGSLKQPAPKHSFGLFRRQAKVLFCGDGVNDAPALAIADVGVSMGEGAALAMEMSEVTLMDSNLNKLLYVIKMGTRVMFTVQENIILSLLCKAVVVGLTFSGHMTLLYAIASDVGVMLIVTLNGMKLLPGQAEVALSKSRRRTNQKIYDELPIEGTPSLTNVAEIV